MSTLYDFCKDSEFVSRDTSQTIVEIEFDGDSAIISNCPANFLNEDDLNKVKDQIRDVCCDDDWNTSCEKCWNIKIEE